MSAPPGHSSGGSPGAGADGRQGGRERFWAFRSSLPTAVRSRSEAFAIVAEPDDVVTKVKARYGDILDRVAAMVPFADRAKQQEFIEMLRK